MELVFAKMDGVELVVLLRLVPTVVPETESARKTNVSADKDGEARIARWPVPRTMRPSPHQTYCKREKAPFMIIRQCLVRLIDAELPPLLLFRRSLKLNQLFRFEMTNS